LQRLGLPEQTIDDTQEFTTLVHLATVMGAAPIAASPAFAALLRAFRLTDEQRATLATHNPTLLELFV
jgi:hypothetical protein